LGDQLQLPVAFWKRHVQAVLVILPFLIPQQLVASDDFCGDPQSKVSIYASIPVLRAGNLYDFLETQSIDRTQGIEAFLQRSPELAASSQSSLSEIATYLYALNDLYSYMSRDSSEGIGTLISERLRGEIDSLYFNQNTLTRRISFREDGVEEAKIEYAAYGTYTFISEGNVSISIKIVRLGDGETRTFVAVGQPLAATKTLASKIFDAFQFPSRSSITNPFAGKVWVGGEGVGVGTRMRVADAAEYCSALSSELPTKTDVMLASTLGPYVTGARIDPEESHVVTDDGTVSTFVPATGTCFSASNDATETAVVLCLKTQP
jgi:hypothetical protein